MRQTKHEPSEIELLLPWYAAGTLDARDSQQVETALANDPELAARYARVRAELGRDHPSQRDAGRAVGPRDGSSCSPRSTPSRRASGAIVDIGARIGEFFAGAVAAHLAWSASAAALAIVLQAGLMADIVIKEQSAGYETASAPANGKATARTRSFASSRRPRRRHRQLSRQQQIQYRGRPGRRAGCSGSRSRPTKLAKADLMRVVTTLQGDKVVDFIALTE